MLVVTCAVFEVIVSTTITLITIYKTWYKAFLGGKKYVQNLWSDLPLWSITKILDFKKPFIISRVHIVVFIIKLIV